LFLVGLVVVADGLFRDARRIDERLVGGLEVLNVNPVRLAEAGSGESGSGSRSLYFSKNVLSTSSEGVAILSANVLTATGTASILARRLSCW